MLMKFTSIRHRLVLSITLFVALLLIAIAVGTYAYFRSTTEKLIVDQQFSLITSIARDLDHDIKTAQNSLIDIADLAPEFLVNNPEETQKWLATVKPGVFNLTLCVLDQAGALIASTPVMPEKYGISFAHRDYFVNTIKTGKPVISAPFVTVVNDHPAIMMTALLRAADGSVKGVLCGAVDLLAEGGLFEIIRDVHIGSSGYLYLFAPDRTMIMHPDRSRVMKKDVLPGANVFFDKALEGFEGSGETVNSKGVANLASFKRLQTTGWLLAANYPVLEVFEPITRFRNYFLLGMLVVLLSAVALSWKLGSGFARPIEGFVSKLNNLAKPDSDRKQRLDSRRADELGVLAASFNMLLDEVQRNEQELKEAQVQVLQSEKLASVGQLAAGVAHEINNPIGFVNSNLSTLKGQVADLLNVLEAYQKAEAVLAGHADILAAIEQAKSVADLEFLREDIVALINESLEGGGRVKKIVDNLKDFSRVDSAEWQSTNLETGLESTLNIVWNEIKYKAEVVKDYAGLPQIECIVAQLNQVFLNLLVNAAQAIEERGTITLRTGFDENNVWVEVADTGSGISPEHLEKIFDPFFSTKPIGKGTGLGLSLAYGIIKRHHGRIEVQSELSKGSVFRVTLPRAGVEGNA
jgi:signal transduction histidine kinase